MGPQTVPCDCARWARGKDPRRAFRAMWTGSSGVSDGPSRRGRTLQRVPPFTFDIANVLILHKDRRSLTLIGPVIDDTNGIAIGETLLVPTRLGRLTPCECVDLPLVNLGPERMHWARVTVVGVSLDEVLVGARATRQS